MPLASYSPDQVERIARVARLIDAVLTRVADAVAPGVSTADLDELARDLLARAALEPPPEMPDRSDGRRACLFANVNGVAAHGLPSDRPLRVGDVLTLDCVARDAEGWHADLARPVAVGERSPVVDGAARVTRAGIEAAIVGARWSAVVEAARAESGRLGLRLVLGLGGHGIGRRPHERPRAVYEPFDPRRDDFELRPGLVLTIEPVVTDADAGETFAGPGALGEVRLGGSVRCACLEESVAITPAGPRVLAGG